MKNPIIEIPRASEKLINALIDAGVLEVGADDMLHVKENRFPNRPKQGTYNQTTM